MTYDDLELAIQNYCQNGETSFVDAINDFIISAEDKAFAAVKGPLYYKTTTDGTTPSTVTKTITAVGVIDVLSVRLCEEQAGTIDVDGPDRFLLRKDTEFLKEAYPATAAGVQEGIPSFYSVGAGSVSGTDTQLTLRFGPVPDSVYDFEVEYYGKALTDSITSGNTPEVRTTGTARSTPATTATWISNAYPDVLLWGSLVSAYTYMKGEADVLAQYQKNFDEALLLMKNLAEKRQEEDDFKVDPSPQG